MRAIIHLGFGKTATTTLQRDILPYLEENEIIEIIDTTKIEEDFMNFILFDDVPKPFSFKENGKIKFVSLESLIGWNPYSWSKCFEFNKLYFPKQSEIMITFRRQEDYLNSVYIQMLHQGESDLLPGDFFIDSINHNRFAKLLGNSIFLSTRHFNIDLFNYNTIAELYPSYFNKCYFFDIESILSQSFLKYLFDEISFKKIPINSYNKSYSLKSVKFDRKRYKLLKKLNLRPISTTHQILFMKLPSFLLHYQNQKVKSSNIIKSAIKYVLFPIYLLKILFFNWRHFLQGYVSILFPKKYLIETKEVIRFYDENEKFYDSLPLKIEI